MKAFGAMGSGAAKPAASAPAAGSAPAASAEDDDVAMAIALSLDEKSGNGESKDESKTGGTQDEKDHAEALAAVEQEESEDWDGEEMVPLPVDKEILKQLTDMGFPDVRGRKAIHHGVHLDGAVAWLSEHQDDPDIDQPYMVRKRDTIPKIPLTAEEKAEKVAAMQKKILELRKVKAERAKQDAIDSEKKRREQGKKSTEIDDIRESTQRRLEAARAKKEKQDQVKERERLRAEIAADKAERLANKGMLKSVLGVDGYNPSAVQYDGPAKEGGAAPAASNSSAASAAATMATAPSAAKKASGSSGPPPPLENPGRTVDQALETLARYRAGGDGGAAMKLLITFLKNIVENPDEPKYRSINTEGKAFISKLTPLVGPVLLLRAVGFIKNEDNKFVLVDSYDADFFKTTYDKLVAAEVKYRRNNA